MYDMASSSREQGEPTEAHPRKRTTQARRVRTKGFFVYAYQSTRATHQPKAKTRPREVSVQGRKNLDEASLEDKQRTLK